MRLTDPLVQTRAIRVLFAAIALLYTIILPPFEVPDEPAHFAKTVQLAFWTYPSVHPAGQPGAMLPAPYANLIQDWPHGAVQQGVTSRPVSLIAAGLRAPQNPDQPPAFADFGTLGSYPPLLYVPQAAGLRLAALAGLPPLAQFYAGRLAGCLTAIAMILAASSLMPVGGTAMLIIAALPGVSGQLASFSADAMIFWLAFLTFAITLRSTEARPHWLMPPLIAALTLAKGVYLPIAFAGLATPAARRPRLLALTAGSAALGVALFILWFGVLAGDAINRQHFISSRTLQHAVSATPHEQVAFTLAHPFFVAKTILATLLARLPVYVIDIIGRFGWLSVLLPLPLYPLGAAVLASAVCVTNPTAPLPTPPQRALWLALALLGMLMIHAALYVTASTLGEDFVEAVQGRYLVPYLPLIAAALLWRPGPRIGRLVGTALLPATALLMAAGLATACLAFWRL